jgi:hypothetical protein
MRILRNHRIYRLDSSARLLSAFNKPAVRMPFYAYKGRHSSTFLC